MGYVRRGFGLGAMTVFGILADPEAVGLPPASSIISRSNSGKHGGSSSPAAALERAKTPPPCRPHLHHRIHP